MRNSQTYVFLDSNINLLSLDRNQSAVEYLNTVHSNSFIQLIDKATRIAGNASNIHTYSLIDHILYNGKSKSITSGTVTYDISDHFMTFVVTDLCLDHPRSRKPITKRLVNTVTLDNFKNYLNSLSWRDVLECNDVNRSL